MNRFEWISVSSVDEAIEQLRSGAVVKAGGVDLLDRMKEGLDSPERVVGIGSVPDLDAIRADETALHVGALATLAEIGSSPQVASRWPALAQAASSAATPQIRNVATVGGNLLQRPRCWYFRSSDFDCLKKGGDRCYAQDGENQFHAVFDNEVCAIVHPSGMAVPLIAYGAAVDIAGPKERRRVPLESFFVHPSDDMEREHSLRPDELVVGIEVPAPGAGTRSAYIKQGEKESFDWPIADVAVALEMAGSTVRSASIVLGAAAAVPRRAKSSEEFLVGRALTEETAGEAARLAMEGATPLSRNSYKIPLFRAIIARTLLRAEQG